MPLINSTKKTARIIALVNEGKENQAASSLGLTVSGKIPGATSLLERFSNAAWLSRRTHNGGLLVTPEEKNGSPRMILESLFNAETDLNESINMLAVNTMSAMSTLSENGMGIVNNTVISENTINGVKDTFMDGMTLVSDSISDAFNSTINLNIAAGNAFSEALEGAPKFSYSNLLKKAFAGTTALMSLSKILDFAENNQRLVSESMNTHDIFANSDTAMFSSLDLQENASDLFYNMTKFSRQAADLIQENKNNIDSLFIGSIAKVALPITENNYTFNSMSLKSLFENSLCSVAALYDEYLQDICA